MDNENSYLKHLVGKAVTKTQMTTSTTFALENNKTDKSDPRMEIALGIFFEDFYLEIYNPIEIIPSDKGLDDFRGLTVVVAKEDNDEAGLIFNNGYKILINMRDEAYYGPEAMYLSGPDNFFVVWN
ncbi:MAG TPA: hypothetical protein VFI06_07965 [Chitinophagaceae bacterium]|nr:hypothetical protein [Chitinophagaceae bacterium]